MNEIDIETGEGYGPDPELEESIGPPRLYATTNTRPLYVAGQGSAGGRIVDPRGGMTNVRFNEPMARMRDLREVAARIQFDIRRLSGMMTGLNQTVASQANNNLMTSLFSLILGGPKLESVTVEKITIPPKPSGTGSSSATAIDDPANFPAVVDVKDTKYKLDIMTFLPILFSQMGNQMGYGSNPGGGMFGGSNFMMMFALLMLFKTMNEDK
jgi:hypothetical protein